MRWLIPVFALALILLLPATGAHCAPPQKHKGKLKQTNFESSTKAYNAFFPIPPDEETSRSARYLDKKIQIHSSISAEHKAPSKDLYIKYTINMEPLPKYTAYRDEVNTRIDEIINFYEQRYDFHIVHLQDYNGNDTWGRDITIEFDDGRTPENERSESYKPWYIRRIVFYKDHHIFVLEALGSQEYLLAPTTERFFNTFHVN